MALKLVFVVGDRAQLVSSQNNVRNYKLTTDLI